MQEHALKITKTARYFTHGDLHEGTPTLWIVLHGYGMLANYFLKNFEVLDPDQHCVVAPEGVHRFYTKGFSGRVGASWMTKEARENDISDYITYLNQLYDELKSKVGSETKIVVLGFSQGAATLSRWMCNGHAKADHFVLWAGVFPPDVSLKVNAGIMNRMHNWLVCGNNDEFINDQQFDEHIQMFKDNGIKYTVLGFAGKHRVEEKALLKLASSVVQD